MSWFSQGYEKVEERQKQLDEQQNRVFLPNLIVKNHDENVYVSFVTSEPITFYEHFMKHLKRSFTCPDGGDTSKGTCPLCAMGNKPSFRGAYLVIDHRKEQFESKKEQGKIIEQQHTLKVAKFGIRVLKQLQKLDEKIKKGTPTMEANPKGILAQPFDVTRSGEGTDTSYTFVPVHPNPNLFPNTPMVDGKPLEKEPRELVVEAIKPLERQKLLEVVGRQTGGTTQATPQPIGEPIDLGDDSEDVIKFE